MKRSPLKRKTRMSRGSGFKLGSTLKRRPPKKRMGIDGGIWRRDLGPCVVCPFEGGECRGPVQAHHIVPASVLRRMPMPAALLIDVRNRLAVCEHRHEQHTTRYRPIPSAVLPAGAFEFAEEIDIGWHLDRYYTPAVVVEAVA